MFTPLQRREEVIREKAQKKEGKKEENTIKKDSKRIKEENREKYE